MVSKRMSGRAKGVVVRLRAYGVALLSVAIALGATLLLWPWIAPTSTPLFLVAVMVSAGYGGWQAGLLATVISTLAVGYFFMEPHYSLQVVNLDAGMRLGTFLTAASAISLLNQSRHMALKKAKKALQALQYSTSQAQSASVEATIAKERLETVLSSINDGFYVLDRQWRITFVNDRYCEMVQMPASALLGQPLWELFPAAIDSEAYVQFHRAMREQTPLQFEYCYAPWQCWHDHRIYPSPTGLTVLIADITDRKQAEAEREQILQREQVLHQQAETAEAKLQQVLASLRENFILLNVDWQVVYLNDQATETMQLSREVALGKSLWDLFPDLVGSEFYDRLQGVMRDRIPVQFEYYYASWNIWFENRVYPTPDGIVNLCSDITERKQAELNEQFINQLETQLRQLPTAKAMLAKMVSSVGNYLSADRCLWSRISELEDSAVVEQEWQRQSVVSMMGRYQLSAFMMPDLTATFRAGQPVVVPDVTTHPSTADFADNFAALDLRAFLTVPCMYEGQWMATLTVNSTTVRQWRSDEVALLQTLVTRLWPLIEQTRAVQQLRRSEADFRSLANAMPQIVYVSDAAGELEFINDRWIEYTGLTIEQSRDRSRISQMMPPEDFEQIQADFAQAQVAQLPYQSQFRLLQPDGSYFHFLTRAVPVFDTQGQVYKWYGTSTDVTELKQLEAELLQKNAILNVINESSPAPIFVKDRTGRIIFANPATLEVLGKSESEVMGYRDCDLYPHPEDAARVMDNDCRIMESGQMEVVEESPDGIRTFLSMKVPYYNEAGEVVGLIGIANDISDRIQIERDRDRLLQQEQAARKAAEHANRIKDEFLAVVSHELRTPLNPILGWAQLLQRGKLSEEKTAKALATIERNAQLQSQLIDDLLDVSRILRGKLSLDMLPTDLRAVISAALETIQLAAEAKSLHIQTQFSPEAIAVMGDAGRLQQVVWNLLSNAVKFTPAQGQISISLGLVGDHAQLQVIDTGKGIDSSFVPFVFEHFRQEDGATTRQFGGLGLGLAIVKQIVELHGGLVFAQSLGEGQGATFTVQIPLAQRIEPAVLAPVTAVTEGLEGVRILVVDDEPDSREIVAFVLEQAGATVTSAASADEALQIVNQTAFDLIVSDIGMPEMDGYSLMRRIRAQLPESQVPAIALTAYAGELDRSAALTAGFQQHLPKPVDPQKLIRTLNRLRQERLDFKTD